MNRKTLLILMILAFAAIGAANAQTLLFSEDFENTSMPTGWTQEGSGTWTFQIGDHNNGVGGAGHGTYNALCDHTSPNNVTKLITPIIDLSSVSSAELSFMHVQRAWGGDIDALKVYYRTSTSGTWMQLEEYSSAYASWTTESGIILPNLCSTYQLAFECTDNYGYGLGIDYVNIVQGASCPKPASLTAVANGQSAILNWTSDAASFDIAWSLNPNANPDQFIETTGHTATTFTRSDLAIDADYYFWVRANCGNDDISTWAGPVSVHIGYCTPAPTSVDNNGISHVTFGTGSYVVDNETPKALYADYHDQIGEVEAGIEATVAITYKTGYTYNTYIWVDLDNSLSFEQSEIVYSGESTNSNPTTLIATFTIPATQTPGDFRMRIGGADSGMSSVSNANPCYTGSYACFQDYTLRVIEGTPLNYVTSISSMEDWNEFCRTVNNGLDYSGMTVTLENNISVTTIAGTQNHPFNGTFNGQGNTLSVNIASIGSQGNAPFHYISNATIQNLVVEGTVNAGSGDNNRHAAGLVGYALSGTNTLEQCLVKTNVNSSCDYAGGIIGHGKTSNIVMTGCVYAGTITATGTNPVGGLIGWSDNLTGLTLTDCFFCGSYNNSNGSRKFHPIGCTGNASQITGTRTITRCPYILDQSNLDNTTQTLVYNLNEWGQHVYSITGDPGISVDLAGDISTNYSYSHLAFYNPGLKSENIVYAASGDQVSLNLDGSSDGYAAMPGNLTGNSNPYTLEMAASNILIISGTVDYITEINSAEDWNRFCQLVNDFGLDYSGKTINLNANISVTTMAGTYTSDSEYSAFSGTFDGNGHTLTINVSNQTRFAAPFKCVNGATIQNLRTAGTISGVSGSNNDGKLLGGVVGVSFGNTYVIGCSSSATITANHGADAAFGGIVASQKSGELTIDGCVFEGTLGGGTSNTRCGGIMSYQYGGNCTVSNSLFAPAAIEVSTADDSYTYTITRATNATITNCFYTRVLGKAQTGSKQVYTITGDEGITVEMDGTATNTYANIGYSLYNPGLIFNNTIYASSGDEVSLNLSGSDNGYTALPGQLTGDSNPYTLQMTGNNTIITTHIDFITEINSTEDWNRFCQLINESGHNYSGETVTLTNDITISKRAGTSKAISFQGTFDGQGHTLTLSGGDFGTSSSAQSSSDCAPFRFVAGATFLNLKVAGDIYSSGQKAAGFIGTAGHGDLTFTNCVSAVNIHASRSNNDGTHGGFIGNLQGAKDQNGEGLYLTASFNGCAFTGSITTTNGTNNVGGFLGWCEWKNDSSDKGYCSLVLNNCLVAPNASGITSGSKTFARCRNEGNSLTLNNSYYLQTIGDAQGKKAYTITGDEGITVDFYGDPTTSYNVSTLSFYGTGFKYNNVLYAGSGDSLSLNLEGSNDGYGAVPGELTGDSNPYTLTMASNNTLIIAGTINYITEIYSTEDWITFCQAINNLGHEYSGDTVTLMNDITISTTAGSDDTPFRGTFNGGGNTITLDFGSTSNYLDQRCAPFYRIGDATIKNVVIDGNIYSSQQNNASLVCRVETGTNNYIINCISSVSIHSNRSGDGTNGGFVALLNSNNCTVNFEGCAFVGELIGSNTTNWGGFVGWREYQNGNYNYVNFTNCFFGPTTANISTSSGTNSRTFCRSREGSTTGATYTNCYYTTTLQANDGGRQAYTIAGTQGVTVAMAGTANATYDISGLSFYTPGFTLTRDNNTTLYAGSGDNVSLNLDGSDNGYTALPGELTGDSNPYTLQMTGNNTLITSHVEYITEINNVDDWNTFCMVVIGGHDYSGETVNLNADISVTTICGSSSLFFKGTFDGQGHTITVDFTSSDSKCALFSVVQNVTIQNLKVTGTINTSHIQTAGFIGYANGNCTITNCISDVTIISSYGNHGGRAAGFIGQTDSQAHVTFTGCAFTGKLLGESTSGCAGFVGFNYSHYSAWAQSGSATVSFTDCVFAPAEVTMTVGSGNAMSVKSATFARSFGSSSSSQDSSEGLTFNNCYYTQSFGTVQGKQAYSITSFETNINPVTVGLYGEHTYYDVSDIDGYTIGIVYNGTIYAGNGENVSLALEGSPSGAYDATYGTITGTDNPFTLTMVAHDTEISALTCPAPIELVATTTSNSAVLNWNGISDNYNLRLYEAHFFDSFEEDLSQWTIYKEGDDGSMEWGIENPNENSADLNAHSGSYAAVSYSDINIHADSWLISPQILMPTQATLKFWIRRYTYDDAQDEYEVRLSTTGNAIEDFDIILKEKAAANSAWTEVDIDLSAYDGQQCYIAIRHDYTDGFFIMVDDFGIYGWSEPISINGNTYTVENLRPETYYQWQVQADCGDEDGVSFWSEGDFTTLNACPIPADLNVTQETAYGATIAWTGYSESYDIWVGQLEMTTINYDFEDNTISADFTNNDTNPWTVTSNDKHSGTYSVKSGGAGTDNATSDLKLEVTVEHDATLSFWARISSEANYDKGYFSIDGANQSNLNGISGNGSWINYTYTLGAGTHTLRWYYTKDSSVNSNDDCFYVDDITIESNVILSEMNYTATESPFILNDATNILPQSTYMVKVKGICADEETEYSEAVTFTTLGENTKIFVTEGDWNDGDNWVPAGVPSIEQDVVLRAEATVFDIAEANNITIDDAGRLTIEDGGQLKTNANVEATMKKFIIGYGTDYVETNNGYYLMALPTAAPISAADAGLLTEESDYDLYSWDRTATDEEWQNNHNGIDLQNGMGYLYANRDDMEMSFTATLRNSSEPVVVTPAYDDVEHGGWNLCGNPFPCEAYITTDAEGMTFYRLVDNQLELIEGAIAPMEAFFVKATAAGQTFTISREMPRE